MRKFSLSVRIFLFVIGQLLLILCGLAWYVIHSQKQQIMRNIEGQIVADLLDATQTINLQLSQKQRFLNSQMKTVRYICEISGNISLSETEFDDLTVQNQITKENQDITINRLYIGGEPLLNNMAYINKIAELTDSYTTVFQKFPGGYVRVATNVIDEKGNSTVGSYIPSESPVVQQIEAGKPYEGRAFVVNQWYRTVYESIYYNNEIIGMLFIGSREFDYTNLKQYINSKKIFKEGYIFLVDTEGNLLIHPTEEGRNIKHLPQFTSLLNTNNDSIIKIENKDDKHNIIRWYATYIPTFDKFAVVSVSDSEYFGVLTKLTTILIIAFVLSCVLLSTGILFIITPITNSINKLAKAIRILSQGEIPDKLMSKRTDEINDITSSLNVLIERLSNTAHFAREIGKGDYTVEFTPLSERDILGSALIDMRKSLITAKEEEDRRKIEVLERNWTNQGFAMFAEILSNNQSDINQLSYTIISTLVKYLQANQGGVFLVNDNYTKDIFIELTACIAYDRQKNIQKRLGLTEGLIGRCIAEGETYYMTEIPENYITITSGVGDATPRCLLIVPLKANEKVFGAIEIASFNKLARYEIDFVEKIGENIASALASAQMNYRTATLLEQSRRQTDLMTAQEDALRQNIEEMISAQEDIARKENLARGFVDSVNHTMIRANFSLEGGLIYANTRFLDLVNLTSMQAKEILVFDFFEQTGNDKLFAVWSKLAKGGKHFEGELCFHKKFNAGKIFATFTSIRDSNANPLEILLLAVRLDSTE